MLYQIVHDNKSNLWCGPAAIAAVTGQPTSVIHRVLRPYQRGGKVMGVSNSALLAAMRDLGYDIETRIDCHGTKTLAGFHASYKGLFADKPMIVHVRNHYVVVCGRRFVDSQHKDPILFSDAPRYKRSAMFSAWSFVRKRDPDLHEAPPRKRNNALAKARRLALKYGIVIDSAGGGGRFVTYPPFADDDPMEGNQFAADAHEVLELVEAYIKHIDGGYWAAVREPSLDPEHPLSDNVAKLIERRPMPPMQIACELSLGFGIDVNVKHVRGAVLQLIRRGRARYYRGNVKLLEAA